MPVAFFYASVVFYWIGYYLTYALFVEMVELQAKRAITSLERDFIVLGHAMANGSIRMISPIIGHFMNIPPQLLCACCLIINAFILVALHS